MSTDTSLKKLLETYLFVGFSGNANSSSPSASTASLNSPTDNNNNSSGSSSSFPEKLLVFLRVQEDHDKDKVKDYNRRDRRKSNLTYYPGMSNAPSAASSALPSPDGLIPFSLSGMIGNSGDITKTRIVCLTLKKSGKIRLHKVKMTGPTSFDISKTWHLEDIKSIDGLPSSLSSPASTSASASNTSPKFTVVLNKSYTWSAESFEKKAEFLYTLIRLCAKYGKKQPKLTNINESELKAAISAESETAYLLSKNKDLDASRLSDATGDLDSDDRLNAGKDATAAEEATVIDLSEVLNDFDWKISGDAAALEARLYNELLALEAANVHALLQSEEQSLEVISKLDKAVLELELVDKWLSEYTDMLDCMGQDVQEIESKNKNLQVAAINQKLLLSELDTLLTTLQLPNWVLETLSKSRLDNSDELERTEQAAYKLQQVLQTKFEESLDKMGAVQERMSYFGKYASDFASRFHTFLKSRITSLVESVLAKPRVPNANSPLPKFHSFDSVTMFLNNYGMLIKWMKEMDPRRNNELQMDYVIHVNKLYRKEISYFMDVLKTGFLIKKTKEDEPDYIFTAAQSTLTSASNALKSAVRSGASGAVLESLSGSVRRRNSLSSIPRGQLDESDKMTGEECFDYAMSSVIPILVKEENYLVTLFAFRAEEDMNSSSNALSKPKLTPKIAARLRELMEGIFDGTQTECHTLMDTCLRNDLTISLRMLVKVEDLLREQQDLYSRTDAASSSQNINASGNQLSVQTPRHHTRTSSSSNLSSSPFSISVLEKLQKRLTDIFERFMDEQIRIINETHSTLKKRSGILPFIRVFPLLVDRLESCLDNWDGPASFLLTRTYEKLSKAIFDTVEKIAKSEEPTSPTGASTAAPNTTTASSSTTNQSSQNDDKEMLNRHILMIENMHTIQTALRTRKIKSFDASIKLAKQMYDTHLDLYVKFVIRKPLGKLLEFFEGVEEQMRKGSAEEVGFHLSFSKAALRDVVKKYPGKEIKEGLKTLYKRVDKHFSPEVGLHQVVWHGIQESFTKQLKRFEELIAKCYPDSGIRLEVSMAELLMYFSELARSH